MKRLGLPKARYYDWKRQAERDRLADARSVGLCYHRILPEKEAVIAYALTQDPRGVAFSNARNV